MWILAGEKARTSWAEHRRGLCTEATRVPLCHLPAPEHPAPLTCPYPPSHSPACPEPSAHKTCPELGWEGLICSPSPGRDKESASLHLGQEPLATHNVMLWDVTQGVFKFWISQWDCLFVTGRAGTRLKQHHPGNPDQTSYALPCAKLSAPGSSQIPS